MISPEVDRMRVLVAMSGGVDSSVAAARLQQAGHEVIGVTLHLWDYPDDAPAKSRCCAPEDIYDAQRAADHLGIPHYAFDRRDLFERTVVRPFVDSYVDGRTPSPCVWCNRRVKIPELLDLTTSLGADCFATGHYARILLDSTGTPRLHRGRDRVKDQSYFLHMLQPAELERMLLPLGDSLKGEVRADARARGLPAADKGESQELCFVPACGYADFVEQRAADRIRAGHLEDDAGRPLGPHAGIHRYTVGQRKGLGVALGQPAFVTAIDAERGAIRVGSADQASSSQAVLTETSWQDDVVFPVQALVKVRSQHEGARATVTVESTDSAGPQPGGEPSAPRLPGQPSHCVIRFEQPVRGVCPGQIAVAFDGDRVLGGGTIAAGDDPAAARAAAREDNEA